MTTPTFPLEITTYNLIAEYIQGLDSNGIGGAYRQILDRRKEGEAVMAFVETLLSRIYNHFQPLDIVKSAHANAEKESGDIEGFLAVKWTVNKEIYEILQRRLKTDNWSRELDRHIKKLMFQMSLGIMALEEKKF